MRDENKNSVLPDSDTTTEKNDARLNLLYEIGRILASLETMNEAAPQILETICRVLEFELGELWCLGKDQTTLRLENAWHLPAAPLEKFVAASRRFRFPASEGLPGKVWAKSAPVWITDLSGEDGLPRRFFIEETGLRSAFAFPILLGEKLLGVFSFFSRPSRQPDDALLQIFAAVGSHIGQFIKREKIESSLRESEDRYRAFISQSTEGIWRFELDEKFPVSLPVNEQVKLAFERGYLAECNDAMARMYGLEKAADLVGSRIANLLDMSDAANFEYLRSFIESGYDLIDAESHEKDKDGGDKYFLNSLIGTIENGYLVRVWGTQRDITEQKRAEQALVENEGRYRALVEATSTVVWRANESGELSFVGSFWENISGQSIEEILGSGWLDAVHPDDRENTIRVWQRALASKEIYETEFRVLTIGGEYRWFAVRGVPVLNPAGGVREWIGANTDINERKRVEEAVRASEANFRQLAEAVPQFVWVTEIDGSLRYVNEQWLEYSGLTHEQANDAEVLAQVFHPEDAPRLANKWERAFSSGKELEVEIRMRNRCGEYRWFLTRSRPIKDAHGKITKWFGTSTDITDVKQAESRLALLAQISELTRTTEGTNELLFAVAQAVGEHLQVRRCLFNEIDLELDCETIHRDYCRGVESVAGVHRISDYSSITSAEMIAGKTVVNRDSKTDSRTAKDYLKAYEPNGERAYIAVPLLRENRWTASLWVSDDKPRQWSGQEVSLLETIAERTWTALEKLRINNALRESEARFRNMADHAPVMVWVTDPTGYCTYLSQSWYDFTGQTSETGLGFGWLDATHPDDLKTAETAFLTSNERREPFRAEYRLRRVDGSYAWAIDSAQPRFGKNGEYLGYIGSVIDITERKAAEEKVRESEQRLQLAVDISRISTFHIDLKTDAFETDETGRAIYGFETNEPLTFTKIQSRFHPEDAGEVVRLMKAAFAPEGSDEFEVEHRIIRTDGDVRWIRIRGRAFFGVEGAHETEEERQAVYCLGTYIDITSSKRGEEALLERERLALLNSDVSRALIKDSSLPDILRACTEAVVKHLDAAFARVWTLDEKENMLELQASSGIYTHLDGEHSRVPVGKFKIGIIAAERQPHLTNSVVGDVRVGNQEWAKHEKMVAFAGYPLLVEDRLVGVVAMFARQPLTEKTVEALAAVSNVIALGIERKHTESERERLLASEQRAREVAENANHSKDEFIALVSHELRSPLNAMLGWTRILQEQKPDEKTREYALDVIVRNARSQSRLIEDLLDIARVGKGKLRLELQPTELIPIINAAIEIIKPTAEASNIKLSQTLDRAANFITGDVDRLRQVIENLLSNAVKFTPPDGSVSVSLERDEMDAKIIISDTGQGISQEFLPQIFERFKQADPSTTRRHGGLGIGLSLARDLVELHGGAISAESSGEGEGATFTVTLPLRMVAPIKENSDKVELMDAQGKLSGFWILAVDDEADARELVSFMLQINGAKVTTANSAVEALDILKNTDGRLPDIVLSDISMPNESGYALLEKIRALPSEHGGLIPAVALTAFNRPEDREAAFDAGFQRHLGKPVEPDELISAIIETARAK
jgi:PAS domain S-box-containing protein